MQIPDDLNNLKKQFISIDDLFTLVLSVQPVTERKVAQWLLSKNILRRSKALAFKNNYILEEFEHSKELSLMPPIEAIRLIAEGGIAFDTEFVGFARFQLLTDLKNSGIAISAKAIAESEPYLSINSYENDDNFYKNQCIALRQQYVSISNKKLIDQPVKQKQNIRHIDLLDPQKPLMYNKRLACLLRVTYDLLHLEKFDHQPTKRKRVSDCLEEYGDDYGYPATGTNIKLFADLIHTRDKSKKVAKEVIENIINLH